MKYAARGSMLLLGGFLTMTSSCVRAAGQGGGHGGSGGHGLGGHGGHLSGGFSSGRSSGHSIGHSFAHIFGHHGQGVSPTALKGASPPEHGKVTPSLESVPRVLDRLPRNGFVSGPPICFFPRRRAFGLGGCPYGWVEHDFNFGGNWNCSNDGFFFDPFFSAWFSGPVPYGSAFGGTTWFKGGTAPDPTVQSPAEPNPAYPATDSDVTNETPNFSEGTMPSPNGMKAERPITLLQLRDGSMYGLTDYWVSDVELHYTTTYGGQNSLPFERIDFEKTVRLNAGGAVPILLPRSSVPR
jgi:hypothetical protein